MGFEVSLHWERGCRKGLVAFTTLSPACANALTCGKAWQVKNVPGFQVKQSQLEESALGIRTEMSPLPLEESGLPCWRQGIPLCWTLPSSLRASPGQGWGAVRGWKGLM